MLGGPDWASLVPMPSPPSVSPGYSLVFDRALMVAGLVHARQKRKGTEVPYLTHSAHVAMILARHGYPEPLLAAAALHDVLEDLRPEDPDLQQALRDTFPAHFREAPEDRDGFRTAVERFLASEFTDEVMVLVRGVTDEKYRADGTRRPWAEVKHLSHARLADPATPADVVVLKSADALHNARQIVNDLRAHGLSMMRRFNATPDATLRHYAGVWQVAVGRLGASHPLVRELGQAIHELAVTLEEQFDAARQRVHQVMRDVTVLPPE
jgi:(p)ppGpp synthase/HD superfamily hydrolase